MITPPVQHLVTTLAEKSGIKALVMQWCPRYQLSTINKWVSSSMSVWQTELTAKSREPASSSAESPPNLPADAQKNADCAGIGRCSFCNQASASAVRILQHAHTRENGTTRRRLQGCSVIELSKVLTEVFRPLKRLYQPGDVLAFAVAFHE
jgi:hypothetical protein